MTKYASERIWRTPDGKLIPEDQVKDGQAGGLGTTLAYAVGDPIEGDDEEKVSGKLASSKAPDAGAGNTGLATAAGTSAPTPPAAPTKADLQARAEELGLSKSGTKDELTAAIAEEEARLKAEADSNGAGDGDQDGEA